MVKKYSGGAFVPGGTYFSTKGWEFIAVPQEGDFLEGEGVTYYRFPLLLVLVLGPLAGLAFVLFLPVAVPAVIVYALGRRLAQAIRSHRPLRLKLRRPFAR